MKFVKTLMVEKPLSEVVVCFKNRDRFAEWHDGFIGIKNLEKTDAMQMVLEYEINERQVDVEMCVKNDNLPEDFTATYLINGLYNKVSNRFDRITDNRTNWVVTTEYSTSNLILNIVFMIRPKTFTNITVKYMQKFKQMVENES